MALFAFGGAIGILLMNTALNSSSITGETMVAMLLPSIPIAIAANVPTELFIIPGLLIRGRRRGARRVLIAVAAAFYLLLQVWTYLVSAGDRLDFAAAERSTTALTPTEKESLTAGLHLDDPRWVLNWLIFAVFLLAASLSRGASSHAVSGRPRRRWQHTPTAPAVTSAARSPPGSRASCTHSPSRTSTIGA